MARRRRPPGSESAGYHYDASIRDYQPKTPTAAPSLGQAARGPAGLYAGAGAEYHAAVEALPPAAQAVTKKITAAASRARRRQERRQKRSARRVKRIKREVRREEREKRRTQAAVLASVGKQRRQRQAHRQEPTQLRTRSSETAPRSTQPAVRGSKPTLPRRPNPERDPFEATISSKPQPKVTRQERQKARSQIRNAKRAVRQSMPDLSGLSPEERRAAKLDIKIGPKFGIPPSVLMAQQRQESGFNPAAVSSAGAQGISQFIPSTAASYGVHYGTGQKEVRSQIRGQAKLLRDSGFATDPKGALTAYTGGYSDAEYNNPVLSRGAPRGRRRCRQGWGLIDGNPG